MGKVVGLILLGLVFIGGIASCSAAVFVKNTYNQATRMNEDVGEKWSEVENAYQRRLDLVPNIANTVNRYMKHEQGVLTDVIKARAEATKVTIKADSLNPEMLQKFQAAQDSFSSALSRLMVTVEKYPDLKAVGPVQDMMTQLEGTENRIAVSRTRYNETANSYNKHIKVFPNNLVTNYFRFEPKPLFKSQEGADKAPKVFSDQG